METIYKAHNGNQYPIELYYEEIDSTDICYEPEKIECLCKQGCRNYGKSGGCPPLAPKFPQIIKFSDKYSLIIAKFNSQFKPEKVKNCNNRAIHWKFQDGILARFMDRLGKDLVFRFGGMYLGTGYCMGCPGKKCAIKLGDPCRRPNRRTFSLEATGINVVKTVKSVFNEDFYWYSKNNTDVPYMMKCILCNLACCNPDDLRTFMETYHVK